MGRVLSLLFGIAALALGLYFIWPDVSFFIKAGTGGPAGAGGMSDTVRLTFLQGLEKGEHGLLSLSLVLLPAMYFLNKIFGNKLYSAFAVIVFSALCVIFALVLHASFIDGYAFFISKHKIWTSIERPAAIFVIVGGNWIIAFSEMYRAVKVGGK